MNLAFEKVRTNIATSQKRQKDYYDKKISGKEINVGDRVMLYNPAVKPGRTEKLHCPWEKEPYDEPLAKISNVDYHIRKRDAKPKVVHFYVLKKCVAQDATERQTIERNRKETRNARMEPKQK